MITEGQQSHAQNLPSLLVNVSHTHVGKIFLFSPFTCALYIPLPLLLMLCPIPQLIRALISERILHLFGSNLISVVTSFDRVDAPCFVCIHSALHNGCDKSTTWLVTVLLCNAI